MNELHAAVWIDHQEAKIFHVESGSFDVAAVQAPHGHLRRHPTVTAERNHPEDALHFYRDVAKALEGAERILVVGPATAKLELVKYIAKHDHALEPKIVGIETVDHPSDRQFAAYARSYFEVADKLR